MNKGRDKYSRQIIDIIGNTKRIPGWSISDYIDKTHDLYLKLSRGERHKFRQSLLNLLDGEEYLSDVIVLIWRKFKLISACPQLIRLFLSPPMNLKEDGVDIGTEGVRIDALVALGELECLKVIPFIESLLNNMVTGEKTNVLPVSFNSCGILISTLAKLSFKKSSKYFGWWLWKAQEIDRINVDFVNSLDDFRRMKKLNIAPDISDSLYGAGVVRECLVVIAKMYKLSGLKRWLRLVRLKQLKDRVYLRVQIKELFEGGHPLVYFKRIIKYRGDDEKLADELASLPLCCTFR